MRLYVTIVLLFSLLISPGCIGVIATAIIIKKKKDRARQVAAANATPCLTVETPVEEKKNDGNIVENF